MSYLGASDIIYSDVIDSFISEKLKYESSVIESLTQNSEPYYSHPYKYIQRAICLCMVNTQKEREN